MEEKIEDIGSEELGLRIENLIVGQLKASALVDACRAELQKRIEAKTEKETETDAEGGSAREFDTFWKVYPNKKAKQSAMVAWVNASDRPPIGQLLEIIQKHQESEEWTKDDGRFIPAPAKWLSGGCWDDELKPKKAEFVSRFK